MGCLHPTATMVVVAPAQMPGKPYVLQTIVMLEVFRQMQCDLLALLGRIIRDHDPAMYITTSASYGDASANDTWMADFIHNMYFIQ